ncbi:MAG: ThuA domain-containing protein [Anaerolineales bacterium]|nr:ThuA domain-containing protein [Anaerolineales bacterium]
MTKRFLQLFLWLGPLLGVMACLAPGDTVSRASATVPDASSFAVLVFSKTAGFRHDSIPAGIAAIQTLGQTHDFQVDATEDAAIFTSGQLAAYQVVIFLNTTGDILNESQQAAFEQFIQNGGGFVGVHAASDTEYDWPWYGQLMGAYFASHPAIQTATIQVSDPAHPAMQPLPTQWTRTDEWYNFQALPAGSINILAQLDESTYSGGTMGANHPIIWNHAFDGGRAWYTALGHTIDSYSEPLFLAHLLGGIRWAAGQTELAHRVSLPVLVNGAG